MSEAASDGAATAVIEQEQSAGTPRVVLRGVQALRLDDLTGEQRKRVLDLVGTEHVGEGWFAVAARTGTPEAAVASYAGRSGEPSCTPGKYKAPPTGAWFVRAQHVEPPLS